MQIQGFSLKLDEAALPWRATRHAGVSWIALHAPDAGGDPASDATADAKSDSRRGSLQGTPKDGVNDGRPRRSGSSADSTVLIRMEPGCGYPAHRHLDVEDVLILSGGYRDETGEHHAGAYLRYPADSIHAPVALGDRARPTGPENPACLLFAVARGGVQNLGR